MIQEIFQESDMGIIAGLGDLVAVRSLKNLEERQRAIGESEAGIGTVVINMAS